MSGIKGIAVIFGTRPEAIKLAPVIRELEGRGHAPAIINTGQHRELLDPLLRRMSITATVNLDAMRDNQPLSGLTARLSDSLGQALRKLGPDAVIIQGDTTTALCGALAAFYERIPVAHVEAGLRSGVLEDPFPEELNRRLVSQLTRWHFAPTARARDALRAEGIDSSSIEVTGNTVIDNLFWVVDQGFGRSAFTGEPGTSGKRRILVTLHRRENQGYRMGGVAEVLRRLAGRGDVEIVLPLHRSPTVRDVLIPALGGQPGITLVEALDYPDFTATLAACDLVITDSGGVQEEAPSLGKPVLVARDTTERPEAIEAGAARLVGTDVAALFGAATALLDDADLYASMASVVNPFGDGKAAHRIVTRLFTDLGA
ncbi:MAG TPA: UDP-N-acetylglucosamine 2-epimerase (non-hydrolyzing) [Streptosporangiaceae bacterium]|jgi:UDP-N-acetylglucosamine 2-epimerase (non-hydrolysing)